MEEAKQRERIVARVEAYIDAFSSERLRWIMGRALIPELMDEEEWSRLAEKVIAEEKERSLILNEIKRGPCTIPRLSETTGMPKKRVLHHILVLRKEGLIEEVGEEGDYYLYGITR